MASLFFLQDCEERNLSLICLQGCFHSLLKHVQVISTYFLWSLPISFFCYDVVVSFILLYNHLCLILVWYLMLMTVYICFQWRVSSLTSCFLNGDVPKLYCSIGFTNALLSLNHTFNLNFDFFVPYPCSTYFESCFLELCSSISASNESIFSPFLHVSISLLEIVVYSPQGVVLFCLHLWSLLLSC